MRIILEKPQPLENLRKIYNDKAVFITTTKTYPLVSEIEIPGDYLSAMRKRVVPVRVGKRVDKLVAKYAKKLERIWDKRVRDIADMLKPEVNEKGSVATDLHKADRRQTVKQKVEDLKNELKRAARPMFRSAYQLGKERGQILTNQELDNDLNEEDDELLEEKEDWNEEHLSLLAAALYAQLADTMEVDYDSEEALITALDAAQKKERYRLANFAGALGAAVLAAGVGQALRDIQVLDNEGKPTGEVKTDPDTGFPLGELFAGGYWHTSHDERVCDGCEANEGKWMTIEEFQDEANTNECLSNCRCIELFEPAAIPEVAGDMWTGTPGIDKALGLEKGGAGSGNFGHAGRPGQVGGSGDGGTGEAPRMPGEKTPRQARLEQYSRANTIEEVPEDRRKAPVGRMVSGVVVGYDKDSYDPLNYKVHMRLEASVEKGLNRLPISHKHLIKDITIDDDIKNNDVSDKAKEHADAILAYTNLPSGAMVFNAGAGKEILALADKVHEETILHETGHMAFSNFITGPGRFISMNQGKEAAEAMFEPWKTTMNAVLKHENAAYETDTLLDGNEKTASLQEIFSGLYRAYISHGEKMQRLYPESYNLFKEQIFKGQEFRRGKIVEKADEGYVLPHYELPDGTRVYTAKPIPELEQIAKHLQGQHDQQDHAGGRTAAPEEPVTQQPTGTETQPQAITPEALAELSERYPNLSTEKLQAQAARAEELHAAHRPVAQQIVQDLSQFQGATVTSRIKEPMSMIEKVGRKGKGSVDELTDVSGIRVMANQGIEQINTVADHIRRNYNVVEEENYVENPKEGYRSLHFIVQDRNTGLKSEVQVRTPNQDKWAVWAHDLTYKTGPSFRDAIATARTEVMSYAEQMSTYFFSIDKGIDTIKPDCIEVLRRLSQCL